MKPKAYSYIRFSSPEQEKGDSLRRQTEYSRRVAEKLGLTLDDSLRLTDRGLSAYRGDHRTRGALGEFLRLVDRGAIPPGSILIIEALDRLSREGMLEAIHLMTGILLKGIDLYTAMDDKHFKKTSYELADLIISATKLQQGHEESEKKSIRLKAAWSHKRTQANNNEAKLTGRCPAWLKLSSDKKRFIMVPRRAEVVQSIFKMKLEGKGTWSIERVLNAEATPWHPAPIRANSEGGWRKSYIDKILRNPAVIGEYQPHRMENGKRVPTGPPIADYYPPVIEREVFDRVQAIITQNKNRAGNSGGRNGAVNNLFGHIAVCRKCGGPLAFVNKGQPPRGGQYLQCDKARRGMGCDRELIRYERVENLILLYCKGLDAGDIVPGRHQQQSELNDLQNRLQAIQHQYEGYQSKLDTILDHLENTKSPELRASLEPRFEKTVAEQKRLREQKAELEARVQQLTNETQNIEEQLKTSQELIDLMGQLSGPERVEVRLNLRDQFRRLITKAIIGPEAIALFFKNGERRLLNIKDGVVMFDANPKRDRSINHI